MKKSYAEMTREELIKCIDRVERSKQRAVEGWVRVCRQEIASARAWKEKSDEWMEAAYRLRELVEDEDSGWSESDPLKVVGNVIYLPSNPRV